MPTRPCKKLPDYDGLTQMWLNSVERKAINELRERATRDPNKRWPELDVTQIIPLGDGYRISIGNCERDELWQRAVCLWRSWKKPLHGENYAVLCAYFNAIAKMKEGDKYKDVI